MAFDISRNTFNAWNDYLGVLMQQGRVHLDSDWNELLAEFTRRIQAGSLDVVGLTGVPSTTPGAFQISVTVDSSGSAHLGIGAGRMYVDGILAENHGASSAVQWDPTLGDLAGTAVDYSAQPYVLGAALPASGSGSGHYLVYLDVWQREVSYLQDPDLVDPAVGIDTTGRLQTVWQVKLLDVGAFAGPFAGSTPDAALWNATTATPAGIAAGPMWQTLIQGSPSLLSSGPAQGYTGQENQLYRVQIHQGGSPAATSTLPITLPFPGGTATFKWSRENASVAAGVTAITPGTNSLAQPASQLTVTSLGRDQVLGFNVGDWIEITDDFLELNGTSSALGSASSTQCGELHYIDSINTAALTITLDSPVSTSNFPLTNGFTDPSRHTRIRRWDQSGTVYLADGQTPYANLQSANTTADAQPVLLGNAGIPVPPPGTSLILENGITVAFDLNAAGSGAFQSGDYWTLAARSADGSVTALTTAPPQGIGHHLCRLAIVDFTATPPAVVSDCRTVFQSLANPSIQVTNVAPVSGTQLQSGGTLSVQNLMQGINIYFNSPIAQAVIGSVNPICYITVQIPDSGGGWLTPAILQGTVASTGTTAIPWSITWTPATPVESTLSPLIAAAPSGALAACLTLKGDGIYADGGPPLIYLNGAPVADGRAFADFNLWFSINSEPPVTSSAQSLTFPTPIIVGNQSTVLPLTLANNTGGEIPFSGTGTGIAITGPNAADFLINNNTCGTSIGGNSSCSMNIVFSPTSLTPFTPTRSATLSATLTVPDSTTNPEVLSVALSGTALAPWLSATPSGLSFPATVVGQTSTLTVTLSNAGTAVLSISLIAISGTPPAAPAIKAASPALAITKVRDIIKAAETKTLEVKTFDKIAEKVTDIITIPPVATAAPGDFAQSSNCVPPGGGTLQPGQACTVTVNFTPSATGVRIAYLVISHNAAGSLNSIPLTGSGILSTKLQEVKITDRVIIGTTKLSDQIKLSALTEHTAAPAAATAESSTLKSFITPAERPAVSPAEKPKSG